MGPLSFCGVVALSSVRLWEADELRGAVGFLVCHTLNLLMRTPLSILIIEGPRENYWNDINVIL